MVSMNFISVFGRFTLLTTFICAQFFTTQLFAQKDKAQEGMFVKEDNFSSFKRPNQTKNLDSWMLLNDEKYINHPDFGILEENAPCENCVEILSKRKVDERYYVDAQDTTKFFIQKANGELHYASNGQLVTIDHALKQERTNLYTSFYYLNPTWIDADNGFVRMETPTGDFTFNNWKLYKRVNGELIHLSNPDWSNHTAGNDGVFVNNIFPGIDAEFKVYRGAIKTNFKVRKNNFGTFEALVFIDEFSDVNGGSIETRFANDLSNEGVDAVLIQKNGSPIAQMEEAIAYPESARVRDDVQNLLYKTEGNKVSVIVPFSLISKYDGKQVLIIDPLVSGTNSLAQAAITGSQYNASCNFDNSCNHFLTVATPANATLTDVLWSFTYTAAGLCWLEDGAVRFATGACLSPSAAGFYWFCNMTGGGTCTGTNISVFNDLGGCLPAPSCTPQNVNFTMQFFRRCWGAAGCNNACIGAGSPWTMTIQGFTVEYSNLVNPISLSSASVCEGDAITATTSGQNGVPGYTYNWSFSPTGTPSVGTGASSPITFPTSGNQTLYSIVTDACGNTSTASINVNVIASPTPTIVGDAVYCLGETAAISTQAFSSYNWSTGGATQNINVTDADNPITVTVTDANGCTGTSAPFNVTESPLPNPTISGDTEYCAGSTATIGTQAFSSYTWSSGGAAQNENVTAADNPITVTVTDANGCVGTSAPYNVVENPTPTPTITGPSTYCAGNTANISTQVYNDYNWSTGGTGQNVSVTDADNPITVTVTDANGCVGTSAPFNVTEELNIQYSETVEICQGQTATIHGNVESTAGVYAQTFTTATCDSIATITLVVNPLPAITASATLEEYCIGGNTDLSAAGGSTYTWDNGLGAGANHTVSPGTTTTYEVTGTDANGCSNTAQIQITVNPLPTVSAGSDISACLGDNVTLTGGGAVSYVWDNGVVDGDPFSPALGTTTYTVIGTDANGCSNTDNVDVTVNPLPNIEAGVDQEVCDGDEVTLSGSGGVAYIWDNGVTDGTPFTPSVGNVVYTVTGTDANGCVNTATVTVTVLPNPTADFTATPSSGQSPLTVLFTNNSSNGTTYTWDFGNGDSDMTATPTDVGSTFTEPGVYIVVLVVDNGLCSSTTSTTITVEDLPLLFNLPNIFTPNGDGSNDIMHLSLFNAERVYVEIFNRWGNQVGMIDSVDPLDGWSGLDMKSGEPVSEGVYFYTYEIEDLNGELITGHQFVHLKR